VGLLIIALLAFIGILISFVLPDIIYPNETHTQYLSHVKLFLPILEFIFFSVGIVISLRVRKRKIPGRVIKGYNISPDIRTEIRIPESSYRKIQNIDPIKNLEEKLDYYRNSAENDSMILPELAKRLLTLSIMYKTMDIKKSKMYREEAIGILNREDYPETPEGEEVRNFAKNI
jgi:hypothetical protein